MSTFEVDGEAIAEEEVRHLRELKALVRELFIFANQTGMYIWVAKNSEMADDPESQEAKGVKRMREIVGVKHVKAK